MLILRKVNTNLRIRFSQQRVFVAVLLLMMVLSLFGNSKSAMAQDAPEYDEIGIFLMIQGVGGYEMDAIYMNDRIYIPVADLFGFLKINHTVSRNFDSISGFFLREQELYLISVIDRSVVVGANRYPLDETLIFRTPSGLYLRNDIFGKAFGLNLNFNFRSLSLELKTSLELPIIKELRLEQMRKNVNRLRGEVAVDTTLKRDYHLFRGGMADWSVISSQSSGGTSDTRASLALGAEFLGGETNVMLNYSSRTGFDERQQQYRWRWANNDAKIVRQVTAGKIQPRSIASIYAPVIGVTATNTPTTFRKSFGSYVLTDYTEPGWTVELYINNVIVDFATADASGFFSFDVPLVYGSSQITLKFYGPWGEERIREQTINVPYNFLPKGTMEYNVSSGVIRDTSNAIYSRAEAGVGVHRNLTVGGGLEYLSSLKDGPSIPFLNTSFRFFNNFLFSGEYAHGVKTRGLLNYRLPSNLVFELDYTNYVAGQTAISFNYLEERKASLSLPIKVGGFRSFARMSYKQNVLQQVTYSTAEVLLSTYVKGVSANISGFANWLSEGNPYMYSNVALGFKLGRSTSFRPQAQIDLTNKKLISLKAELEKSFSQKAFLSLVYEENIRSAYRSFEVSFRYDLPFAQTSASARLANKRLLTTESARGSFAFGSGNGYVHVDNRSGVGRGGMTIVPFLDVNHNGIHDKNEPFATGLNIRINGGRILKQQNDSLIRVVELEPFASYLLEIDDNSFENIAWQLEDKLFSIYIDPNQFKVVNIPVKVMGEANGMVYLKEGKHQKGQGRIFVNFMDSTGAIVHRTLSEQDGFYNYLGFAPGRYSAVIDSTQLSRLNMIADPPRIDFEIIAYEFGDIVDDLTFILISTLPQPEILPAEEAKPVSAPEKPLSPEEKTAEPEIQQTKPPKSETPEIKPAEKPVQTDLRDNDPVKQLNKAMQERDTPGFEVRTELAADTEIIEGNINLSAGRFLVQAGAFGNPENARAFKNKLCPDYNYLCGIVKEGGLYKLRFGYFATAEEAVQCAEAISRSGSIVFVGVISGP
ncbi:MAG: hypothetical protein CVT94_17990 [Bacteroidetes bacterium HGW-Bacteroidetes-11]|nr:MAG: hypothetical protein CVT94_17990 [Bacteroidetes bacterium HGW-Bacteroidetes-11]